MSRRASSPISLGPAYRIERELGGGGMSRVFLATEVALGRAVAVKVLPPELSQDVGKDRFRREIQMAASLQHPHIVPLLAAGEAGGALFYTMPMVQGESLRARFARDVPLPLADQVRILREVAEALAYAHGRGVVHRDIKPDNLLLVDGTHVQVVDFGVAKAISSAMRMDAPDAGSDADLTSAGIALGTPSYMAPEQAAADPDADHRMDIYALGALGYEMLRGEPLFAGLSPARVLAAQVSKQPEPLERRDDVPEALYAIVETCLAKMPADRFQTASDVVDALREVQAELLMQTPARGARKALTSRRWWRHGRRFVAAAIALVAAVGSVAFARGAFSRGVVDGRTLRERDAVLVANFTDGGTGLGAVIADALRTDLTQSPLVRVVQPVAVREALDRMQRAPGVPVDSALAYEVAVREGIPAYVIGDVVSVGQGFQLTARLMSADSGFVLAAVRESARDSSDVIATIDRLSKSLRGRLGESLRDLQAGAPLARVTTISLDALRRYTEAVDAIDMLGDYPRGYRLLDEAIALDSTFAMALRKYAVALGNRGERPQRAHQLLEQAMRHRDRLTALEGHMLAGSWYSTKGPEHDLSRAALAYNAVLAIYPAEPRAMNNLAIIHLERGEFAQAEALLTRAVSEVPSALLYSNLVEAQVALDRYETAGRTSSDFLGRFPAHPLAHVASASVSYAQGDLDGAERALRRLRTLGDNDIGVRRMADGALSALLLMRGRLAESDSMVAAYLQADPGVESATELAVQTRRAIVRVWFGGDALSASRDLAVVRQQLQHGDTALQRVSSAEPLLMLARGFALAGKVDDARAMLAAYRDHGDPAEALDRVPMAFTTAEIALQQHDFEAAIDAIKDVPRYAACPDCLAGEQGRILDLAGATDAAITRYTAFVQRLRWSRLEEDAFLIAPTLKRLGELSEARGEKQLAAGYYVRYLDVFDGADAELQPQVELVRQRLARLKPV